MRSEIDAARQEERDKCAAVLERIAEMMRQVGLTEPADDLIAEAALWRAGHVGAIPRVAKHRS